MIDIYYLIFFKGDIRGDNWVNNSDDKKGVTSVDDDRVEKLGEYNKCNYLYYYS